MSYDYGLFKTIDESIDHFSKVTDITITRWDYSVEDIQQAITDIIPEIKWWHDDPTYGQVINPDWGRFECSFDMKDCFIVVRTSFHVDYKHLAIAIAKALELTAFDVQTGERAYNPYEGTEVAGSNSSTMTQSQKSQERNP